MKFSIVRENFLRCRSSIRRTTIEATLEPAVGSHDNMTSTDRVLFSKGDSTDAPTAGEIANYRRQLDTTRRVAASRHHTIGLRNNNIHDTARRVMVIERNSVGYL